MPLSPEVDTAPAWLRALGYRRWESEDWGPYWEWVGYPGLRELWIPSWAISVLGALVWGGLAVATILQWWGRARSVIWAPAVGMTTLILGDCLMAEHIADLFTDLLIPIYLAPLWAGVWWYWPLRRATSRAVWAIVALPLILNPGTMLTLLDFEGSMNEWRMLLPVLVTWTGLAWLMMHAHTMRRPAGVQRFLSLVYLSLLGWRLAGVHEASAEWAMWLGALVPWVWIVAARAPVRREALAC